MERKAIHALLLSLAVITGAVTITTDAHAQTNTDRLITVLDNTNEANSLLSDILDAMTNGFAQVLEMLGVVDEDLKALHTDLDNVHGDLTTIHTDLEALDGDVNAVGDSVNEVQSSVDGLERSIGGLVAAASSLAAPADNSEVLAAIADADSSAEVSALSDSIASLEANIESILGYVTPEEAVMVEVEETDAEMANATDVRAAVANVVGDGTTVDIDAIVDAVLGATNAQLADANDRANAAESRAATAEAKVTTAEADAKDARDALGQIYVNTMAFSVTVADLANLPRNPEVPDNNMYTAPFNLVCGEDVYLDEASVTDIKAELNAAVVRTQGTLVPTTVSVDRLTPFYNTAFDPDGDVAASDPAVTLEHPPHDFGNTQLSANTPQSITVRTTAGAITLDYNTADHDVDIGFMINDYAHSLHVKNDTLIDSATNDVIPDDTTNDPVDIDTIGELEVLEITISWYSGHEDAECELQSAREAIQEVGTEAKTLFFAVMDDGSKTGTIKNGLATVDCTDTATLSRIGVEGIDQVPSRFSLEVYATDDEDDTKEDFKLTTAYDVTGSGFEEFTLEDSIVSDSFTLKTTYVGSEALVTLHYTISEEDSCSESP